MRYLILALMALSLSIQSVRAEERFASPIQIDLTGGFSNGPGYDGRAPEAKLGLEGGTKMFRLHLAGTGLLLHKTETPGGYQVGINAGLEVRFSGASVTGGMTSSHADQTIWTKDVRYAYAGAGYRWDVSPDEHGVPLEMHSAQFVYYWEVSSTYPNHTRVYDVSYRYYRRLGHSPLYFQISAAMGAMAYNDGVLENASGRHTGLLAQFGLGIAWMP